MTHEIRRFDAKTEDGATITVVEHQNMIKVTPAQGPAHEVEGSTELRLDDGREVAQGEAEGTFIIAETGQVIEPIS